MAKAFPFDIYVCSLCASFHKPSKLMWDPQKHVHIRPEFMSCPVCGAPSKKVSYLSQKVEVNKDHKEVKK